MVEILLNAGIFLAAPLILFIVHTCVCGGG